MSKLVDRLRELSHAVTQGPDAVSREFTMSIPVRPERDADLVLYAAAHEIERLREALLSAKDLRTFSDPLGHGGVDAHNKAVLRLKNAALAADAE